MEVTTNTIYSLLKTAKTSGGKYTHVSMGSTKGQYYLSTANNDKFFRMYGKCLLKKTPLCLAEKQDEYVPLLGDIDIKIEVETEDALKSKGTRVLYSTEELLATIKCFQSAIKEVVIQPSESALTCVVLEKKPYLSNGFLKNGFHLHFPYLFLESSKVKNVLVPVIKKKIGECKLDNGKKLFEKHTETPENLVDDITNKCWLMYGSSKSETAKPYKITEIYNHTMDTLDIYDAFSQEPFFNGNEEPIKVTPDNVHSLLPQLLSVSSIKKRVFNVKTPEDLRPPTKIYLKQKLKDMDKMDTETIKKNLIQAKSLVKLLKPDRADNYNTWWDIGIILFNIGQGCDEAFKIWDKWSSKSDNYDEDACLEVWSDMEKRKSYGTKGMGSLKYYARVDNPRGYTQLVESMHGLDLNQDFVRTKILTTDAPLARLLLDIYSGEYIFSDVGWYRFNGTIWLPIKVLQNFRYKLEAVAAKYAHFHTKIIDILYPDQDDTQDSGEGSSDNDSSDDDDDKHKLTKKNKVILSKKLTEINRAINKLENFASQTGVLKMCEVLFYDENFYDQLDQNPQLIAFKNGVFDLETLTFRDGLQTDYLSKTLGVEYKQVNDSSIQKLKSFFQKIFPDASVRKYFIEQSCELFRGGNRDKIAMFWTGTGNNGKSVTQKLFETMIGKKLAIKLSTSVLTDRIQPGQPNPQITRLRGSVRWGVFDEIRKSEQIDCGSLKLLTGGDSLPCRDLFQRGQDSDDFTPMFKFLCICNQLPGLKDVDDATWERIRIIPFESKFVSKAKCPKTIQEQEQRKMFLCDTEITLPKRMEELAEALGWYLIQVLKEKEEQRRNGTYESIIPDKVNEAKLQYQIKCDLLLNFMEDTYIKTGDDKHKMTFDQMFVSFRAWYTDSFVDKKIPFNKQEFIEVIKNKHGLLQSDKVLKGYIYNRKCDDSDSDNE